jgi:hypothetical protein
MDKAELDWQHIAMKKNTQLEKTHFGVTCKEPTNHPTSMALKSEQDLR